MEKYFIEERRLALEFYREMQRERFPNLGDEPMLRVCPKTSGGITKFSEHEAD